jgi:hypothetical protein
VYQVVLQVANKNNLVQHSLLFVKRTTTSLGFCVTRHKADTKIIKEITVTN